MTEAEWLVPKVGDIVCVNHYDQYDVIIVMTNEAGSTNTYGYNAKVLYSTDPGGHAHLSHNANLGEILK